MGHEIPAPQPGLSAIYMAQIDCCNGFDVTEADEKELFFWEYLKEGIDTIFDQAVANKAFGKIDTCLAGTLTSVHQLLLFLQLIDIERAQDAFDATDGLDQGNRYYMDKYCINTIRDRYRCKGFSIQAVLKVFELFDLVNEEDSRDGIGYMQVEGTVAPINRVF